MGDRLFASVVGRKENKLLHLLHLVSPTHAASWHGSRCPSPRCVARMWSWMQSYAHTVGYCSTCISMHRDTAPVSRDWNLSVFSTVRCSVERCMSAQRTLYSRTHDLKCYTRSQPGQSHPCGPSQEAHTALRRCVAESHLVSAHYVPPAGAHRTWQRRGSIRWSQRPASLTLQRQPQLRYSPHL
jgi:hypothetical protein